MHSMHNRFLKHYVSFIMFLLTLRESYSMLLISYSRSLGLLSQAPSMEELNNEKLNRSY